MPEYKPEVGFGLHAGWAVEGALGSSHKIDVSYISPDVSYVEALQDLTKDYGNAVGGGGDGVNNDNDKMVMIRWWQ
jgi:class 3 adenylate cyclase